LDKEIDERERIKILEEAKKIGLDEILR